MVTLCFDSFFFFKQKTAYEMRISDWSSDVCSSDLVQHRATQSHLLAAEFAEGYRGDELATEDAAVMVEGLAGVAVEVEVGVGVFHRGLPLGDRKSVV